jgi:hypothetical protein
MCVNNKLNVEFLCAQVLDLIGIHSFRSSLMDTLFLIKARKLNKTFSYNTIYIK